MPKTKAKPVKKVAKKTVKKQPKKPVKKQERKSSQTPRNHALIEAPQNQIMNPGNVHVQEKAIRDYLFGTNTKLSKEQEDLFISTCKAQNLNPLKQEIYAVPYDEYAKNPDTGYREKVGTKLSIVTGYRTYIKRAKQTGDLEAYNVEEFGSINKTDLNASDYYVIVHIKRKNSDMIFNWTCKFVETAPIKYNFKSKKYYLAGPLWEKQPSFQLRKCAIVQAFRFNFPEIDLPYTHEEMETIIANEEKVVEGEVLMPERKPLPPPEKETEPVPKDIYYSYEIMQQFKKLGIADQVKQKELMIKIIDRDTFKDMTEDQFNSLRSVLADKIAALGNADGK